MTPAGPSAVTGGGLAGALEHALDAVLSHSPMQPVFRRRAARMLTVLAYHGVPDAARFARQLDHLRDTTVPVTLDAVLAALAGGAGLPPRAVLVTFDDGTRSLFEVARPLLAERGMPAAAFIVTGLLDTDQPYWWDEAAELAAAGGTAGGFPPMRPADLVRALKRVTDDRRLAALDDLRASAPAPARRVPQLRRADLPALEDQGIAVGSHSHTHPCLPRCRDGKVAEEVATAHRELTAALGHPPRAFAYPNGDCDARARAAVEAAGYEAAFLFDHRVSDVPPPDRLAVSRVRADAGASLDRFRILVSGLHPAVHRSRGGR